MTISLDDLADIFPARAPFDVQADGDAFFASIPAKACVALLLDINGGPLQLICTKNLRAMLRRRLEAPETSGEPVAPNKRVDYRTLVGGIAWRRVDGEFEMDLAYIEAARRAFPTHWRQLIPDRAAHFVAIDLTHDHPDFTRITDIAAAGNAAVFGPFADRAKADRWIDLARDAFDLCRYRNILTQSPNGRACSYKQMNKCPAPCDGTVPLQTYRSGVSLAVAAMRSPATMIAELSEAMKRHAGQLEFEQAGRVKTRLTTFTALGEGPHKSVRPISEFRFITIQPGPRKGTAKAFVITSNSISEAIDILDAGRADAAEVLTALQASTTTPSPWPGDVLLGTACFHLAGTKTAHRFIAARDATPAAIAALIADAAKPRSATTDESGEAIRETRLQV